jgi:hypothetical protein
LSTYERGERRCDADFTESTDSDKIISHDQTRFRNAVRLVGLPIR